MVEVQSPQKEGMADSVNQVSPLFFSLPKIIPCVPTLPTLPNFFRLYRYFSEFINFVFVSLPFFPSLSSFFRVYRVFSEFIEFLSSLPTFIVFIDFKIRYFFVPTFTDFYRHLPTVNRKFLITDFRLLSTSVKPENFIDFYRSQKKVKDPRSLIISPGPVYVGANLGFLPT